MPLLFNAFVATPPGARAHIDRAIAAYSALCDAGTMATFFKTVVRKLIKVPLPPQGGLLVAFLDISTPENLGNLGLLAAYIAVLATNQAKHIEGMVAYGMHHS